MHRPVLKVVSLLLVLCVLSIGVLAQAQSVEHAGHHAHHQAATHGTVLCSWMCAAGVVLDSEIVRLETHVGPIAVISPVPTVDTSTEPSRVFFGRAPPAFSL